MNEYIKQLSNHLASQPIDFHDWKVNSMLEFLFCCYTEDHPLDNDKILRCCKKMEPVFVGLPRNMSNHLFANIAEVCIEYEIAAFTEGLRVGVALGREFGSV